MYIPGSMLLVHVYLGFFVLLFLSDKQQQLTNTRRSSAAEVRAHVYHKHYGTAADKQYHVPCTYKYHTGIIQQE